MRIDGQNHRLIFVSTIIQATLQPTSQIVVMQVAGVAAGGGVGVLFESEGVDGHGGTTTGGDPTQHTVARGVVHVEVFVS